MTGGAQAVVSVPVVSNILLLPSPRMMKREPGQKLHEVQISFCGLWNPDRKSHTEALGGIYKKMKALAGAAEEAGLGGRLGIVLSEIENFMIDLKSVHLLEKLGDERGWDGLYKIAMHHEGEDRVAAVRALGRHNRIPQLETLAECCSDPIVASSAVLEISRRAKFGGYNSLGDPQSAEVYKLGRIVNGANVFEARSVALFELMGMAGRDDPLGQTAKVEIERLSCVDQVDVKRMEIASRAKAKRIGEEISKAKDIPDDSYNTGAWDARRADGRLQRLTDEIEFLASRL
ncbi:MAG: hypothetical protein ABIF01_04100 [Candidatus Micrarchaeota archaeon]